MTNHALCHEPEGAAVCWGWGEGRSLLGRAVPPVTSALPHGMLEVHAQRRHTWD
eukprot:gene11081-28927_t